MVPACGMPSPGPGVGDVTSSRESWPGGEGSTRLYGTAGADEELAR